MMMERDLERHVIIGDQVFRGNIAAHVKSKMFLKLAKMLIYAMASTNQQKNEIKETIFRLYKEGNRIIFIKKHDGPPMSMDTMVIKIDNIDYVPVEDAKFKDKIGRTLREKLEKMTLQPDEQVIATTLEQEWGQNPPSSPLEKLESIWAKVEACPSVQSLRGKNSASIATTITSTTTVATPQEKAEGDASNEPHEEEDAGIDEQGPEEDNDGAITMGDATGADLSVLFDDMMSFTSMPPVLNIDVVDNPAPNPAPLPVPDFNDQWSKLDGDLDMDISRYVYHYGFGGIVGESLKRLEQAQLQGKNDWGQNRQEWAKLWAESLARDEPWAWQYNVDRKLCLKFLYRLIDKELVAEFKQFRIDRIVRTCLVMDRANALYNMINHVTNTRGLHWFAEVDLLWMESLLAGNENAIKMVRRARAPLNRRLRGLLDHPHLNYRDDTEIVALMTPTRAPTTE